MCKVFNGRGHGITIEGSVSFGSYFNTIQDNHFFNNGIGHGTSGANIYCGSESSETKVIGGECQSSPGAGWRIDNGNGHAGLGASFEGNSQYGIKVGTISTTPEVFLFGCRAEGAGVMQYGVHITNALTTVSIFGCHLTSNVVGDVYDPDSARVAWAGCNTSSSPVAYRAIGIKQYSNGSPYLNLSGGFFKIQNTGGYAELIGSSSVRITTASNGLELGSANGVLYLQSPVRTISFLSDTGVSWRVGSATPEGATTAAVGSLFTRTDGGAATTLYVKESGTGNTGWIAAPSFLSGSATYDPAGLADAEGATTTVTVTGAALGDFATASFSLDLQGITVTAWVSATNTVSVRFQNESGGAVDLASGTLRAKVQKA
jgi:hypothetical protein